MPKASKKYYRPKTKYSVEQSSFTESIAANAQSATLVVPPTASQGMRKVKHLTVSLAASGAASSAAVFWALVYCPEGVNPSQLAVSTVAGQAAPLYEPNQYVMSCGVVDFSSGPARIVSPVSRNLNSGDRVFLLMANPGPASNATLYAVVRYAISLH